MRLWAVFALIASTAAAQAAESAYTKTDLDRDCREQQADDMGATLLCKGYKDYPVLFAEGDLRQSVFYGHLGDWSKKGAFETFSGFNRAGETTEWRLDGGVPYATIRRWFVSVGTDASGKDLPEAQVLVVSRVGQKDDGEACVVGYVEATANKDANEIARTVADGEARDFACRYAEPMWHGDRRAEISATSYFEDREGVE